MSKLGSKKSGKDKGTNRRTGNGIGCPVQSEGWEVIVGIEPDKEENIDDIKNWKLA